jgi:hypothetical protein
MCASRRSNSASINGPVPVGSAESTTAIWTSVSGSANTHAASHQVSTGCNRSFDPVSSSEAPAIPLIFPRMCRQSRKYVRCALPGSKRCAKPVYRGARLHQTDAVRLYMLRTGVSHQFQFLLRVNPAEENASFPHLVRQLVFVRLSRRIPFDHCTEQRL